MLKLPSIQKALSSIQSILLNILLLATPLMFTTNTKELYEFPKMFFVYAAGSTILFIFAITKILKPSKTLLPSNLILAFVIANIVSTLLSSHSYTSMWGYYSRFNGGLVSTIVLFGIYLVAKNQASNEHAVTRLTENILVLTIVPIGVYGVYQHFQGVLRVYSTFGQPNWLAAYLAMVLPLVLYKLMATNPRYVPRTGLLAIYTVGFAALWYTYSLSGILGLLIGTISLTVISRQLLRTRNVQFLYIGIAAISILIASLSPGIFKERLEDVTTDIKNLISYQTHVYALENSHNLSDPGFIRMGVWKGTLKLVLANPKNLFFGTGPETFPYEFQKYRPPSLNYSSEWDFILNKPHNYYLELLSETGIFGFVPYLALIVWSVKKKHPYITPGLLALYATSFFGWPTVATDLLFWVFIASLEKKL